MMNHEAYWFALAEILGPRSSLLQPLLTAFDGPEGVFAATEAQLRAVIPDLSDGVMSDLLARRDADRAVQISEWCRRHRIRVLTMDSEAYPTALRCIKEPPAVLYCRGKLPLLEDRLAVGVVGTRKADAYGEQITYKLSFEMAAAGAVIVSGMAAGLDAVAAAAALNAGSETIAVLGCGIDVIYPKQHARLADEIAERGAILTEFAPGTRPNGWNFPLRNRLISGLCAAVLVTEADEHSGALITARYGAVQGKTVFAVPGDITAARSAGCNRLLTEGALPALCAEDILGHFGFLYREAIHPEVLAEAKQYSALTPEVLRPYRLRTAVAPEAPVVKESSAEKAPKKRKKAETVVKIEEKGAESAPDLSLLNARQRELFALLPSASFSVDVLTGQGIPVSEAAATLTVFEIYGLIRSRPGGVYEKK